MHDYNLSGDFDGGLEGAVDDWARRVVADHYMVTFVVLIILILVVIYLLYKQYEGMGPGGTMQFQQEAMTTPSSTVSGSASQWCGGSNAVAPHDAWRWYAANVAGNNPDATLHGVSATAAAVQYMDSKSAASIPTSDNALSMVLQGY